MALNTDAAFEKTALGEREASHPDPTDFQDTEKLLSTTTEPGTGESNLKPADSFSLDMRGSIRSLDADQNGHVLQLRSGSAGHLGAAAPPVSPSPSRLSFGPVPSLVPPGAEPPSYLWLAVLSCFCPAVPVNMFALWYAHMSRSVLQTGDVDSAKRLGRLSLVLSCIAMALGVAIVFFIVYSES